MELVAVIAIMAIVAVVAVARSGAAVKKAHRSAAEADMRTIAEAILSTDGGYLADMQGIPGFSASETRLGNLLVSTNLYGMADTGAEGRFAAGTRVDVDAALRGVAPKADFTGWNEVKGRGWRGPYVQGRRGTFPSRDFSRFAGDSGAASRGFFPDVSGLMVPGDFRHDTSISIYGFPGEPAVLDPWGNPYVLQVPPPQAFSNDASRVSPELRWRYARIVSAGEDGRLDAPCFLENPTNDVTVSLWRTGRRRLSRQAGLAEGGDLTARGDDIVLFLNRNDIDEGEER